MRGLLALAAILATFLVALSGLAVVAVLGAEPPIRIGIISRPGHELLSLAEEKAYFAKEGAPVRIVEFPSLLDARRAYERNQIDGLAATLVELAQLRGSRSRRPVAISVLDVSEGGDALFVRQEISDIASLRGRRVGLELETSAELVLARALATAGLELDDVSLVPLHADEAPRALADGEVDAIVAAPPMAVAVERIGGARVLYSSASMPLEVADLLMLDERVLESRPSHADAILRALGRSVELTERAPTIAHRLMGRPEKLSAQGMREALERGYRLPGPAEQARLLAPGGPLDHELRRIAPRLRRSEEGVREGALDGSLTPDVVGRAARG